MIPRRSGGHTRGRPGLRRQQWSEGGHRSSVCPAAQRRTTPFMVQLPPMRVTCRASPSSTSTHANAHGPTWPRRRRRSPTQASTQEPSTPRQRKLHKKRAAKQQAAAPRARDHAARSLQTLSAPDVAALALQLARDGTGTQHTQLLTRLIATVPRPQLWAALCDVAAQW
jgi:hypothetical protein